MDQTPKILMVPFDPGAMKRSGPAFWSALLLIGMLALAEHLLQPALSLTVMYMVPIAAIAWYAGPRRALVCTFWAAAAHGWATFTATTASSSGYAPFLNSALSALFYFAVMLVASAMRATLQFERELARTDALTGLGNRRFFADVATTEIHRTRRYSRSVTLAYVDIDFFKQVNDQYGHAAGDALLLKVAEVLKENLRNSDVMARIGGDEFAIILPETGLAGAKVAMEKCVMSLNTAMKESNWPVSFSIGVVTSDSPTSLEQMLELADQAMYTVKKSGKSAIRYETCGKSLEVSA
jgi:diguanylate cyclase (GGDEF)-like protein